MENFHFEKFCEHVSEGWWSPQIILPRELKMFTPPLASSYLTTYVRLISTLLFHILCILRGIDSQTHFFTNVGMGI